MTSEIKRKALEVGYLACGIIPVNIFGDYKKALDKRVESFPKSKPLYEKLCNFVNQPEDAKSIIVCTQRYNNYKPRESLGGLYGKYYMLDGRMTYAQEHRAMEEFEAYLKTLSLNILKYTIPDRMAAAKAGIGKFGRNNFIYDKQHGSYISIHEWVVDKELEYDPIAEDIYLSACNDNCEKCIEACPTKALDGKFSMNMGRCITRLNTVAGDIPDDETKEQMGTWLYGCDACQDACPCNKDKFTSQDEFPLLDEHEVFLQPETILTMDEETFKNVVHPRFWYIGEDNLWFWKCNALRSLINAGDEKHHSLIKQFCNDEDERIRAIARWGCKKLAI